VKWTAQINQSDHCGTTNGIDQQVRSKNKWHLFSGHSVCSIKQ